MGDLLSFFIFDDLRAAPSLVMVAGETEFGARALALAALRDNPGHRTIEVRAGDRLVFAVGREDLPPAAAPPRPSDPA